MTDNNGNGYARRRIDELIDGRLERIERTQDSTNTKIDRLEARINLIAGALAVLSIAINIVAPFVVHALSGGVVP
jgi:hypothetical protein